LRQSEAWKVVRLRGSVVVVDEEEDVSRKNLEFGLLAAGRTTWAVKSEQEMAPYLVR
jgi:hypothetical protein